MDEPRKLTPNDFFVKAADFEARCWVQGKKLYKFKDGSQRWEPIVANFHERLLQHTLVRKSVTEGWDRELRGHIVAKVRLHIMNGGHVADLHIPDLMPNEKWIEYARDQARRATLAAEWRNQIVARYGSMDAYWAKTASRRQNSAASVAGAAKRVIADLTSRSRAMSGEVSE